MNKNVQLIRKIEQVSSLSNQTKEQMFQLMNLYYTNTFRSQFETDLSEKNRVLLIINSQSNELAGFSTQKIFKTTFNQSTYTILFSGDTIMQHHYWGAGGMELVLAFGELMMQIIDGDPDTPAYWMLISKGLRTYKYLPVFFNEYYPTYTKQTPSEIKLLMNFLGDLKFGDKYNPKTGIIEASEQAQFLKPEYQPEKSIRKPHEKLYYELNPGYEKGDELLCLSPLTMNNLNTFIKEKLLNIKNAVN